MVKVAVGEIEVKGPQSFDLQDGVQDGYQLEAIELLNTDEVQGELVNRAQRGQEFRGVL